MTAEDKQKEIQLKQEIADYTQKYNNTVGRARGSFRNQINIRMAKL